MATKSNGWTITHNINQETGQYTTYTLTCKDQSDGAWNFNNQEKKVTLRCAGQVMTGDVIIDVKAKDGNCVINDKTLTPTITFDSSTRRVSVSGSITNDATFSVGWISNYAGATTSIAANSGITIDDAETNSTPSGYSDSFTPSISLSAMTLSTSSNTWNPTLYPITKAGWVTTGLTVKPSYTVNSRAKQGFITDEYISFENGFHRELRDYDKNSIFILLENNQSWYGRDETSASWFKKEWGEGTVIRWSAKENHWYVLARNGSSAVTSTTWYNYIKGDTQYQCIRISLSGAWL